MEKTTTKKRKPKPRRSQKKKAFQTLVVLGIILVLSIVVLLLLPNPVKISKIETRGESETNQTAEPEKKAREKETPIKTQSPGMIPDSGFTRKEIPDHKGKIAVIIDDAGNNIGDLLPFLQFPHMLTIAVLPQLPSSRESATLSAEAGKDVILHLPMEAEGGMNPGPGALYETNTGEEIIQIIKDDFATVPGAIGANNHMGSKLTANTEIMEIIFTYFSNQGFFFVDSRTSSNTICREIASKTGIPFLERNIFLDDSVDREIIRTQMKKGIALAQKIEYVILIGHVQNSEVLDILYEVIPEVEKIGYSFVGLSEIIGK